MLIRLLLLLLLCTAAWSQTETPASVPFEYLPGSEDGLIHGHLISVPVTLKDGYQTRFILDTGIGVELVSQPLARRLGMPDTGVIYRGQRMSGQEVEVPLSYLTDLSVADQPQKFITCGVWDFTHFLPQTPAFAAIEGFLSLRFFQHRPFTLDYGSNRLIFETAETLEQRAQQGVEVPLTIEDHQGVALTVFAPMQLQGGGNLLMEVDTGSDGLILHRRYMQPLGISENSPDLRVVQAQDETRFSFTRYFTQLRAPFGLGRSERLQRSESRVMFQQILYDGLIGDDYLKGFVVTYDLSRSRMILSPLPPRS